MKKILIFILFSFNCLTFTVSVERKNSVVCPNSKFSSLTSWIQACKEMPKNRDMAQPVKCCKHSPFFKTVENFFDKIIDPVLADTAHKDSFKEFEYILNLWKKMVSTGPLTQEKLWTISNIGKKLPAKTFYDISVGSESFQPYVQKLIAQDNDEFYVHGDLHGDMHSLIKELEFLLNSGVIDENFRIIKNNVWFLFLGDYVDRGKYGVEVIYTLLRLSLANPDRVVLVRGNHEEHKICSFYGFLQEVIEKFSDQEAYYSIVRIYDFLPIALYLGIENKKENLINYIQCCHGGIEVGYDPKSFLDETKTSYQLLGSLYSPELLKTCDKILNETAPEFTSNVMYLGHQGKHIGFSQKYLPEDTMSIGFLWTDFNVRDSALILYNNGRGFEYGSLATKNILQVQSSERSKIRGIIRAHQHSGDMMKPLVRNKGVYKMWRDDEISLARTFKDGLVWTFNVSPDNVYGQQYGYNFHAFAKIILHKNYNDWTMQVFNINV